MSEIDIFLKVKVDDSQLEKDLKEIEKRSGLEIIPKINTSKIENELKKLETKPIIVPVELKTGKLKTNLNTVAKNLSGKKVFLRPGLDDSKINSNFRNIQKKLSRIELNPTVDDKQLIKLNKHLDLKLTHFKEVNDYFNNNPLKIAVDTTEVSKAQEDVKDLIAEYSKLKTIAQEKINFKVTSDVSSIKALNRTIDSTKNNIRSTSKEIESLQDSIQKEITVKVEKPDQPIAIEQELDYSDILSKTTNTIIDNTKQENSQLLIKNAIKTNNHLKTIETDLVAVKKEIKNLANKTNLKQTSFKLSIDSYSKETTQETKRIKTTQSKELEKQSPNNLIRIIRTETARVISTFEKTSSELNNNINSELNKTQASIDVIEESISSLSIKTQASLKTNALINKQSLSTLKSTIEVQTNQIKSILNEVNKNVSGNPINSVLASLIDNLRTELTKDFASSFAKSFFEKSTIDPTATGRKVGTVAGSIGKFGVDIGEDLKKDLKTYFGLVFKRLNVPELSKTLEDLMTDTLLKVAKSEKGLTFSEAWEQIKKDFAESYKNPSEEGGVSPKDQIKEAFKNLSKPSTYSPVGGDDLIAEVDAEIEKRLAELNLRESQLTPEDKEERQIIKEQKEQAIAERNKKVKAIGTANDLTIVNAFSKQIGQRVGSVVDKTLRKRREANLEKSSELALKRAQEILAKTKPESIGKFKQTKNLSDISIGKSIAGNAPQVINEATKELFITIGGFARRKKKDSGLRLAADLATRTDETVSAIGLKNPDTDVASDIKPDEDYERGLLAFAGSVARANLRGYSKDAVEMAAQAISALTINPELTVKFVGESGGGFPAAEATKIMQQLGYGDRVKGVGLGTPEIIGGLEVDNFNKFIGKDLDEKIGYLLHNIIAPIGFGDVSSPTQNLEGLKGHIYEFYKNRPEFEAFIQGDTDVDQEMLKDIGQRVEENKMQALKAENVEQVNETKERIDKDIQGLETLNFRAKTEEQKAQLQKYIKTLKEISNAIESVKLLAKTQSDLKNIKAEVAKIASKPDKNSTKKLVKQVKSVISAQSEILSLLNDDSETIATAAQELFKQLSQTRNILGRPLAKQVPEVYKTRFAVGEIRQDRESPLADEKTKFEEAELNEIIKEANSQKQTIDEIISGIKENIKTKRNEIKEISSQIKQIDPNLKFSQAKAERGSEEAEKVKAQISQLIKAVQKADKTGGSRLNVKDYPAYKVLRERLVFASRFKKEGKQEAKEIEKVISNANKKKKELNAYITESTKQAFPEFEAQKQILEKIEQSAKKRLKQERTKPKKESDIIQDPWDDDEEPPTTPTKKPKPKPPSSPSDAGGQSDIVADPWEGEPPTTVPRKAQGKIPDFDLPRVQAQESTDPFISEIATAINQELDIGIEPIIKGINKALDKLAVEAGMAIGDATIQALERRFILLLQNYIAAAVDKGTKDVIPRLQSFSAKSVKTAIQQSVPNQQEIKQAFRGIDKADTIPTKQEAKIKDSSTPKELEELKAIIKSFKSIQNAAKDLNVDLEVKQAIAQTILNVAKPAEKEIRKFIQSLPKGEATKPGAGATSANLLKQLKDTIKQANQIQANAKKQKEILSTDSPEKLKLLANQIREYFLSQKRILNKPDPQDISPEEKQLLTQQKQVIAQNVLGTEKSARQAINSIDEFSRVSEDLRDILKNIIQSTKKNITESVKIAGGYDLGDIDLSEFQPALQKQTKEIQNLITTLKSESTKDDIELLRKTLKEITRYFDSKLSLITKKFGSPTLKQQQQINLRKTRESKSVLTAAEPVEQQLQKIQSSQIDPQIKPELSSVKEAINKAKSAANQYSSTGDNVVDSLEDSIKKNIKTLTKTGELIGEKLIKGTDDSLEIDSPSKRYMSIGKYVIEGLKKEIVEKVKLIKKLGENLGENLASGTEKSLEEKSKSKRYVRIGKFVIEGFAFGVKGIGKVVSKVDREINKLSPSIYSAIEQAKKFKQEFASGTQGEPTGTFASSVGAFFGEQEIFEATNKAKQATQSTFEEFQNLQSSFSGVANEVGSNNKPSDSPIDSLIAEDNNNVEKSIQSRFKDIGELATKGLSAGFKGIEWALSQVDKEVIEFALRLKGTVGTIGDIKNIVEPILSQVSQVIQNQLLDITRNFEDALSLQATKNILKGFSEDAQKEFDRLVEAANKYGQDIRSLAQTSISFQLSFQGTNIEGTTNEITDNLFQGLSAFNPGTEKFNQAITALSQIASKGVVSMEELRQQLSEALPGALSIAARSMNMTQQEFQNLVSSGNLLAEDFLPKFAKQLKTETFGAFLLNSQSATASLNTLKNEIFLTSAALGQTYVNIGKPFFEFATKALQFIKENLKVFITLFQAALAYNVVQLIGFTATILNSLGLTKNAVGLLIQSLKALKIVLASLMRELLVIGAVAAGIGIVYDAFQLFSGNGNEFIKSVKTTKALTAKMNEDLTNAVKKLNEIRKQQSKPFVFIYQEEEKQKIDLRGQTAFERFQNDLYGEDPRSSRWWTDFADGIFGLFRAQRRISEEELNKLDEKTREKYKKLIDRDSTFFGAKEQAETIIAANEKIIESRKQMERIRNPFLTREEKDESINTIRLLQKEVKELQSELLLGKAFEIPQSEIDRLAKDLRMKTQELARQEEITFPLGGLAGLDQIKRNLIQEREDLTKRLNEQNFKKVVPQIDRINSLLEILKGITQEVSQDTEKITQEYTNITNKVLFLNREIENSRYNAEINLSTTQLELYKKEIKGLISPRELELKLKLADVNKTRSDLNRLTKNISRITSILKKDLTEETKEGILGTKGIDSKSVYRDFAKEALSKAAGIDLTSYVRIALDKEDTRELEDLTNVEITAIVDTFLDDKELKTLKDKYQEFLDKNLLEFKAADVDTAISIFEGQNKTIGDSEKKVLEFLKDLSELRKERIDTEASLLKEEKDVNELTIANAEDSIVKQQEALDITREKVKLSLAEARAAGEISKTQLDQQTREQEIADLKKSIALTEKYITLNKINLAQGLIKTREANQKELELTKQLASQKIDLLEKEQQNREELINIREESLQLIDLEVRKNQTLLASYDRVQNAGLTLYDKLINARQQLANAQSSLGEAQDQGELQRLQKAIELRKTLADDNASFEDKRKARSQLKNLGVTGNLKSLERQREQIQDRADLNRLKALKEQQRLNFQLLQIDRARETLAARRAIEEAKTAKLEASKNVLSAQLELERARITGDDRKIKIAQLGLDIAQKELGLSQQKIKDAQQALQVERQITKLRLDANKKQSQAELLNTTNDIRLNNPDLLIPKRKRSLRDPRSGAKIPADYKPVIDIRLPGGEKFDISEYQQYLKPQPQQLKEAITGLSNVRINPKFEEKIKPENFKPVIDIRLPNGTKLDISEYQDYLTPQQQNKGVDRNLLSTEQSRAFEPLPEYRQASVDDDIKQIFQGFAPISSKDLEPVDRELSRLSEIFPQLGENTLDSTGADKRNRELADKLNQRENVEQKSAYIKNILDTNTKILAKVTELLDSIKSQPLGQIQINNEITQDNQDLAAEVTNKTIQSIVSIIEQAAS